MLWSKAKKVDKTFSVGFKNKGFNETNFSKDLSDILGLKNFSRLLMKENYLME